MALFALSSGKNTAMLNRPPARRHAVSLLCCLLCACALPLQAQAQTRARELVVIVSAKSAVTALQKQQVAAIFLAEAARFPGGADVAAVDQRLDSPVRNEFYSKVAGHSPEQMKAHWSKMIFTGRGQPPREAAGNVAVRRMVAANPALIGYIERSALNASVRAVLVVK
jgi:ABC-type phosphate transport system substrate-binding protein